GHADDVGVDVEVDLLHVLVAKDYLVLRRSQGRHRGEGEVREEAPLTEAGQDSIERPEGFRVTGRDEANFHMVLLGRDSSESRSGMTQQTAHDSGRAPADASSAESGGSGSI